MSELSRPAPLGGRGPVTRVVLGVGPVLVSTVVPFWVDIHIRAFRSAEVPFPRFSQVTSQFRSSELHSYLAPRETLVSTVRPISHGLPVDGMATRCKLWRAWLGRRTVIEKLHVAYKSRQPVTYRRPLGKERLLP